MTSSDSEDRLRRIALYDISGLPTDVCDADYGWEPGTCATLVRRYPDALKRLKNDVYLAVLEKMAAERVITMVHLTRRARTAVEVLDCAVKGIPWTSKSGEREVTKDMRMAAEAMLRMFRDLVDEKEIQAAQEIVKAEAEEEVDEDLLALEQTVTEFGVVGGA